MKKLNQNQKIGKNFIFFILSIGLFCCTNFNKKNDENLIKKDTSIQSNFICDDSTRVINNFINITYLKLNEKKGLNQTDYNNLICYFLIGNNDETYAEGIGSVLYEYYRKNQKENDNLRIYLNRIPIQDRDSFLNQVLLIMCIDISDEYNNYKEFQSDFPIFNDKQKEQFEICSDNSI